MKFGVQNFETLSKAESERLPNLGKSISESANYQLLIQIVHDFVKIY